MMVQKNASRAKLDGIFGRFGSRSSASEGCCGTEDQDYTFRGYTVELWDEAPTVSELNCPNQDDGCLLNEADQISRVYHLQEALVSRAAFWRAQHFGKGPFIAGAFSTQ